VKARVARSSFAIRRAVAGYGSRGTQTSWTPRATTRPLGGSGRRRGHSSPSGLRPELRGAHDVYSQHARGLPCRTSSDLPLKRLRTVCAPARARRIVVPSRYLAGRLQRGWGTRSRADQECSRICACAEPTWKMLRSPTVPLSSGRLTEQKALAVHCRVAGLRRAHLALVGNGGGESPPEFVSVSSALTIGQVLGKAVLAGEVLGSLTARRRRSSLERWETSRMRCLKRFPWAPRHLDAVGGRAGGRCGDGG